MVFVVFLCIVFWFATALARLVFYLEGYLTHPNLPPGHKRAILIILSIIFAPIFYLIVGYNYLKEGK